MPVGNAHRLGQPVAHGMSCRGSGNLDRLSALETCVQHLRSRVRISFQIGLQIVEYADNSQKRMHLAVVVGSPAPVAFDALGQRIQRAGLLMVSRQRIKQRSIKDDAVRPKVCMIQTHFFSVHIDDCELRRFRAGPRSTGNRNMRTRSPAFQSAGFQSLFASRVEPSLDCLGSIHTGTAADGDQSVTPVSQE